MSLLDGVTVGIELCNCTEETENHTYLEKDFANSKQGLIELAEILGASSDGAHSNEIHICIRPVGTDCVFESEEVE